MTTSPKTLETIDVYLAGQADEADTNPGKVAAAKARLAKGSRRPRYARIRTVAEFLATVRAGYRWATTSDYVAAQVAFVQTRDFVRETLEQRAAEGDAFAAMALRAHAPAA